MEYLIGLLVAALGGVFYFKKKADEAVVEAKLAETKGRDAELKKRQEDVRVAISEIDDSLKKIKAKREADRVKLDNMTLKERADLARGRYKK